MVRARALAVQHCFHSGVWRRNTSPLIKTSRAAWCNPNESRRSRRIRGRRFVSDKPTDRGKVKRPRHCEQCCTSDDANIVSRSPNGLESMMTVVVAACDAFGLMVSEAKTEIMCLQTTDGRKVPFNVTTGGQEYKQTAMVVNLGGAISADWTRRRVEVTRRQKLDKFSPHLGPVLTTLLRCVLSIAIQLLQTAELVPGVLLDSTGTTTHVDLIGNSSNTYKTHVLSYLDNTPLLA